MLSFHQIIQVSLTDCLDTGISNLSDVTMVPGAGLEPARPMGQQILSLSRLPIPPSRHNYFQTPLVPHNTMDGVKA